MIYINRATGTVGVKLSSWPTPPDDEKAPAAATMFNSIGDHLVGLRTEPVVDCARSVTSRIGRTTLG